MKNKLIIEKSKQLYDNSWYYLDIKENDEDNIHKTDALHIRTLEGKTIIVLDWSKGKKGFDIQLAEGYTAFYC